MSFRHKTSDIEETNSKKFLTDNEKDIVERLYSFNSTEHNFTKSIDINDSKKLTIPNFNIQGACYQNLLDMIHSDLKFHVYSTSTAGQQAESLYNDNDFIMIKNIDRQNYIVLFVNGGTLLDIIKPSTTYTLVLDFYSSKKITEFRTQIKGKDNKNPNSNELKQLVYANSGRLFMSITTNSVIDRSNPEKACIYCTAFAENMVEGDLFYFGNARLFEGIITEENYISNGRVEGITGVGEKSINLFNPETVQRRGINVTDGTFYSDINLSYMISDFIPVEGGGQYLLYDELGQYTASRFIAEYDSNKTFIKATRLAMSLYNNVERFILDSKTAFVIVRYWSKDFDNGLASIRPQFSPYKNIMFRKDSYTTGVFEPYYEGYKINLQSNNSNIFNADNLVTGNIKGVRSEGTEWSLNYGYTIVRGDIIPESFPKMVCSRYLIKIDPDTVYKVKRAVDFNNLNIRVEKIVFYDENKRSVCEEIDNYSELKIYSSDFSFKTHKNALYMRLVFMTSIDHVLTPSDVENCGFTISKTDLVEPCESDITEIYLDEPLLALPDGTKDEIKDGYLIRRIGNVTIDGGNNSLFNYHQAIWYNDGTFVKLILNNSTVFNKNKNGLCDRLPFYNTNHSTSGDVGCSVNEDGNEFYLCISTNMIGVTATTEGDALLDAFKQWLSNNPVTVYYELETPDISRINYSGLSTFDNHTEIYTTNAIGSVKQFKLPGNINTRIGYNKERLSNLRNRINKLEEISLTSVLSAIDLKDGEENEEI